MNKTWQLRVCALYLTLGLPLGASCARATDTVESGPDDDDGVSGSSAQAGATAKAGTDAGKAGANSAFGGTMGKAGAGSGGSGAQGGDMAAEGGEAPIAGTKTGGAGGSGGAAVGGSGGTGAGGVPPDVLARASAIVYYQTSHTAASDGTIQMKLFIKNQSPDPLPMANVKIRYWFTAEVAAELHQYYTGPQAQLPQAMFVSDGASSHALLTFGGGSIVMGGDMNASEVQLEMTNNTGKFNQADDFSFAPGSTSSTPNDKIALYLDDVLIWGCEPAGACFDDAGAGGAGSGGAGGAP